MSARVDSLESQLRNVEALSNVTAQGLERTRYDDSGFCLAGRFEHGWRKAWRSGGGCQEEARGRWGCLGGAAESPVRCNKAQVFNLVVQQLQEQGLSAEVRQGLAGLRVEGQRSPVADPLGRGCLQARCSGPLRCCRR